MILRIYNGRSPQLFTGNQNAVLANRKIRCIYAVLADKVMICIYLCSCVFMSRLGKELNTISDGYHNLLVIKYVCLSGAL